MMLESLPRDLRRADNGGAATVAWRVFPLCMQHGTALPAPKCRALTDGARSGLGRGLVYIVRQVMAPGPYGMWVTRVYWSILTAIKPSRDRSSRIEPGQAKVPFMRDTHSFG